MIKSVLKNPKEDYQKIKNLIQNKIRESEQRLYNVIQDQTDLIVRWRTNGILTFVNESYCNFFQKTQEELIGTSFIPLIPEEDHELVRKNFELINVKNPIMSHEHRVIKPDGKIAWIHWVNRAIVNENNKVTEYQAVGRETTEKKRVEQKLKESEEKYRILFNNSPVGIALSTIDGKVLTINKVMENITGYTLEEYHEINVKDTYVDSYQREKVIDIIGRNGNVRDYEIKLKRKDGTEFIALMNTDLVELDGRAFLLTNLRDITQIKKVEQDLIESEKKYRSLFENSPVALMDQDLSGMKKSIDRLKASGVNDFNKYFDDHPNDLIEILALSKINKINKKAPEVYRAKNKEDLILNMNQFKENLKQIMTEELFLYNKMELLSLINGEPMYASEIKTKTFTGEDLYLSAKTSIISGFEGTWSNVIVSIIDITNRKEIEKNLRESELRFRTIIENAKEGYFEVNPKGIFTFFNHAFHKLLKYSQDELLGMSYKDIMIESSVDKTYKAFNEVYRTGQEINSLEYTLINKEGEIIYGLTSVNLRYNTKGDIIGFSGFMRDITDKKKAEDAFRREYEFNKKIIQTSPAYYVAINPEGKTILMNEALLKVLGYTLEEVMNEEYLPKFVPKREREKLLNLFRNLRKTYGPASMTNHILTKDGQELLIEWHGRSVFKSNGDFDYTFGFGIDITEQAKAERKLKESEQKYRSFLENFQGIAFQGNTDFTPIFFHGNVEEITGFAEKDFISMTPRWDQIIFDRDRKELNESFKEIRTIPNTVIEREYRIITKSGNQKWIHEVISNICNDNGKPYRVQGIINEITDRKNTENALKESEEKYRRLYETSKDGLSLVDLNGKILDCNKAYLDLLKYDKEIIYEMDYHMFTPEKWRELDHQKDKEAIENGYTDEFEKEYVSSIGEIIPINIRLWTSKDNSGKINGIWGLVRDNSERKKAAEALEASEERYRNLIETSSMGLIEIEISSNKLAYINPKLMEIIGYSYEELMNEITFHKFIYPQDLKEMNMSETNQKLEFRVISKDGKIKWLSGDRIFYYNAEESLSYVRLWLQDITDTKELERIKTNLLMRFSHEFKTPLISIKGFSEFLLEEYRDKLSEKIVSFLEKIQEGANKLKSLTNTFLESYQLDENLIHINLKWENVSQIIERVINGLEGVIKSRKHIIDLKIDKTLSLNCDSEKLYIAITNLILNSSKFTPPRGLITISTTTDKNLVLISIEDTGIGLTEEEKEKLFLPFGKIERYGQGLDIVPDGMGMGLYITKELVELHNGTIWAESGGEIRDQLS